MCAKQRSVFGSPIVAARIVGLLLIAVAILSLPQMQFFTGRYEGVFRLIGSIALLTIGAVWLFGVSALIHFFDEGLSRN